jgi:hypothetical protein
MRSVVFTDGDVPLAGHLHEPEGGGGQAAVVTGSWLTVKEQMPDRYAAELATRGWTALSFDFAGFGASAGTLRQVELPLRKMSNLSAAVRYMSTVSGVRRPPVVLGVCASAQYFMAAVAGGLEVAGFASVAGWYHDTASVEGFYGGAEGVQRRMREASDATERYLATGEIVTAPAYAPGDESAGMFFELDYYADPSRGNVAQWRNEMAVMTWPHWLGFDGLAAAERLAAPTLFVHSDGAVFPEHVRDIAAKAREPVETVWGEGTQTDWYDRPDHVRTAVDAVTRVFG